MDEPSHDDDLIRLIQDTLYTNNPEELEVALRRVARHPDLLQEERLAFYAVWEELSDTLLERWLRFSQRRDIVAWNALHRRDALAGDR